MLLDIREIQHVTAIGRFLNFARAAESLDIRQPTLSKSIRGIEASLGVRLFDQEINPEPEESSIRKWSPTS
jgi:DNA-binding transcriptional LysR family regulator